MKEREHYKVKRSWSGIPYLQLDKEKRLGWFRTDCIQISDLSCSAKTLLQDLKLCEHTTDQGTAQKLILWSHVTEACETNEDLDKVSPELVNKFMTATMQYEPALVERTFVLEQDILPWITNLTAEIKNRSLRTASLGVRSKLDLDCSKFNIELRIGIDFIAVGNQCINLSTLVNATNFGSRNREDILYRMLFILLWRNHLYLDEKPLICTVTKKETNKQQRLSIKQLIGASYSAMINEQNMKDSMTIHTQTMQIFTK